MRHKTHTDRQTRRQTCTYTRYPPAADKQKDAYLVVCRPIDEKHTHTHLHGTVDAHTSCTSTAHYPPVDGGVAPQLVPLQVSVVARGDVVVG